MKIYNKYIVLAAMALTFAACTQEDDFTPQTDGDAVKINATIGAMQTRVAYEDNGATNFINGDKICVQNTLRDTKNIATYTFDGTTWTTTDALVWNGGTAESQFQAWYPATASFDKFTLPTDQISIEELAAADWMTASTSAMVKPADKTINLAFEHKLAKITVEVTEFTSQFGDDPCLYGATIYSLRDEYVTVNGGIIPVLRGNAATAIVCPGKYEPGTDLMSVTISDSDRHQTFLNVPVNAFLTNTGLQAGKHYKFSLKVGKEAVSISSVSVADWNKEEINGGVAEEEVIPTYEYDATSNIYTVYRGKYLQTAFDEAEQTGTTENPATVKIMRDMEVTGIPNEYVDIVEQDLLMDAGVIILDLNGHTLTGKTGHATINIDNGAKLTIGDSSESKSGKIQNLLNNAIDVRNGSTLVVNNGTFEGKYAVFGFSSPTIVINGGTFKATKIAISPQDATLTITGGTFDGDVEALHLLSTTTIALIAGGSFTGGEYDISTSGKTGFLSYNEEGTGATFPGGLSIYVYTNCPTLTDLLVDGAAYYDSSGNQLTLADAATSCEGDVTVKKIPTDE